MDKQASANIPAETANTTSTNVEQSSEDTQAQQSDLESQLRHWKAMSRKNEDRAKANAEKARKFDELEEQSKSELQKALEKATLAEQRAERAEAQALRSRIGAKHGIDPDLLLGTTEEEINDYAQRLLAWRGDKPESNDPPATSSNLSGDRGDKISGPRQLSREDLKNMNAKQINQARKDGQLDELMGV